MSSRVLIADDSKTIQKVISITLANSGYELVEVSNESELLKKIQTDSFDLILLDFSLSESKTGYELAKLVHEKRPEAAIIAMLGTFDPFDDHQGTSSGINDKIVKPFESSKFIKKCRDVLESKDLHDSSPRIFVSEVTKSEEAQTTEDLDSWQVEAPRIYTKEEENPALVNVDRLEDSLDPLSSEMQGWGFTPPKVNIEEKYHKIFPPMIEETPVEPSIIENLFEDGDLVKAFESNSVHDEDRTDPTFHIPEDLSQNLLEEIEDEISPDDFWKVDGVVPVKAIEAEDIGETKLDEVTADLTEKVQAFREQEKAQEIIHSPAPSAPEEPTTLISSIDQEQLVAKLKESIKPMIEELVREYCRQSAEKVAWEVIPDLAENLIRKEIKDIANSL